MNFSIVAIATSIAGLILGIGWFFAGNVLHKRWGIESTASSLLIGRRLGAVYLGISAMLFLGRSAPPSDLRTAVCVGMFAALAILAGLGLFELRAHRAGPGILVSVVLEIILAAGFAWVLLA
ncbi:MAG TPA: hypothetical protein VH765_10430 [Xanthobacteraceae bacterium]|jgi:hypothetical protein